MCYVSVKNAFSQIIYTPIVILHKMYVLFMYFVLDDFKYIENVIEI